MKWIENLRQNYYALLHLSSAILLIIAGVFAGLYYSSDVLDPNKLLITVPIFIVVISLILLFLWGTAKFWQNSKFVFWQKAQFKIKAIFLCGFVLFGIAGNIYLLAGMVFAPREVYPRTETVTYDASFQFQSQYGNIDASILKITRGWNASEPNNTDAYAWGESYYERYMIHYFNASGATNMPLFQELIRRMEIVLSNDDLNHDGEPGFGSAQYSNGIYIEYGVWDGMIFLPIIEAVRLIRAYPLLNQTYGANATRFLDETERMIQKWERTWLEGDGPYGKWGYYEAEPSAVPIYNRLAALGRVLVELYQITENATYLDRITKMGRLCKIAMETVSYWSNNTLLKMYVWPYRQPAQTLVIHQLPGAEDVSHGSIEMDFIDDCYKLGVVFTTTDMERFANTMFDFMFKGFNQTPIFSDKVDGGYDDKTYYRIVREGFAKTYRYYRDPQLAHYILLRTYQHLVDQGETAVGIVGSLVYLLEVQNSSEWV